MLFALSKVAWWISAPGNALLLAVLVGGLLWFTGHLKKLGQLAVGAGFFGLLMIAVLPIGAALLDPLEGRFPRPAAPPMEIDGIVVLGGAIDTITSAATGRPELNAAAERMLEMASLARTYPEAKLIFTGGSGLLLSQDMKEATVARQVLDGLGLAPDRYLLEDRSRNTWENALLSRAIAAPQEGERWLLVTSAFHMPRAIGTFRAAGWPEMIAWPVDERATDDDWRVRLHLSEGLEQTETAVREWLGLLAYRLAGRTDALFPAPRR